MHSASVGHSFRQKPIDQLILLPLLPSAAQRSPQLRRGHRPEDLINKRACGVLLQFYQADALRSAICDCVSWDLYDRGSGAGLLEGQNYL